MTLEQVQYVVTSAEEGSFSGAAKKLFVSHSSVSRGVGGLERELGVLLFVREHSALRCTPAGEAFLVEAKALLRRAETLKRTMEGFQGKKQLRFTSINAYIPRAYELLRQFRETHPEIELELSQDNQMGVTGRLLRGETELGILFSYMLPEVPELETLAIEEGKFCALLSPSHPLAGRSYLTRTDILSVTGLLGENPFRPTEGKRPVEPQNVQSIILEIKAGSGITILPEHAAMEFGQGCVLIPIRDAEATYRLMLCWNKNHVSGALGSAVDFFKSHVEFGEG